MYLETDTAVLDSILSTREKMALITLETQAYSHYVKT